ncbi:MAG: UDP-2,3-diacylglucosamine diphosphatase [Gallionella sp.]|nr:UDP-2,3-diacylglucosamine diphosphatase [Gallionella sp.]MDD4958459.1 UDP-2,3-diacylglucosamine diphosphatase [Gallionella sp.]
MAHILFISDLHLSADQPDITAAFGRFISNHAPHAEAVYILGDLFEYWAGDDDLGELFHREIIAALRTIPQFFVMRGNRDVLLGTAFAEATGATLLDDPTLIDLYGTPTLLSHGDLLCTDDHAYQQFRTQVHSADFQQDFLAKPLVERKAWITQLRARSQQEKQSKTSAIMDVNDLAVDDLLRQHGYPRLIHGHTHRPDFHLHHVDDHRCERWVLADWHAQGSVLRCDKTGCRVVSC